MEGNRVRWIAISVIAILGLIGSITLGILYAQTSGKLGDAEDNITSLESQISTFNSTLTSLDTSLANLNAALEASNQQIDQLNEDLLASKTALSDAVARVSPSVVYIEVAFNDPETGQVAYATGSGVIMSEDGYILTNKHVIAEAIDAIVILQDRRIFYVSDIFEDDILDLAVVKIDAPNLTAATFGDPSQIQLGDTVIALGYPLSMSPEDGGITVTSGIVSNLGRSFFIENDPYYDLIQTDAAINPGNSGGALINLNGEVIGINSAGTFSAQNISFAINVATARHIYEDLVQFGEARHPYMGLFVNDYFEEICGKQGCVEQQVGALITEIEVPGPTFTAGLRLGDVVISMDGEDIYSAADFIRTLWRYDTGDTVSITLLRDTMEIEITLTLPARPTESNYL